MYPEILYELALEGFHILFVEYHEAGTFVLAVLKAYLEKFNEFGDVHIPDPVWKFPLAVKVFALKFALAVALAVIVNVLPFTLPPVTL